MAIDPGGEVARLKQFVSANGITLEKILLTHGHLDHASGAAKLARETDTPIESPHTDDIFLLEALGENTRRSGFAEAEPCVPNRFLLDGDIVTFGEVGLNVRHCPCHTPDHGVFFHDAARIAFVGDVLFKGLSDERTFRAGPRLLIRSITDRLWPLGDDMQFVPGHGATSTFGRERQTNPFVSDLALGRA